MALIRISEIDWTLLNDPTTKNIRPTTFFQQEETRYDLNERFDVYLTHSYQDTKLNRERLLGVKIFLEKLSLRVYVAWHLDPERNQENVSANMAEILRNRMNHSRSLLIAASDGVGRSRWIPWELGYMDGRGGKAAVLPLADRQEQFSGQGFFGMYHHIEAENVSNKGKRLWMNDGTGLLIRFDEWLRTSDRQEHLVSAK